MTVFILILVSLYLYFCLFKGVKSDIKTWSADGSSANFEAFCITIITVAGMVLFGLCVINAINVITI